MKSMLRSTEAKFKWNLYQMWNKIWTIPNNIQNWIFFFADNGNISVTTIGTPVQLSGGDKKESSSSPSTSGSLSVRSSTSLPVSAVLTQQIQSLKPWAPHPLHDGNLHISDSDISDSETEPYPHPTPPSSLVRSHNSGYSKYCTKAHLSNVVSMVIAVLTAVS